MPTLICSLFNNGQECTCHSNMCIDLRNSHAGPQQPDRHPPVGVTDQTRLTDLHHAPLLRQLQIHAARWKDIGTYLGFRQGELDNIQLNAQASANQTTRCLSEMLNKWLQWAPGDTRGSTNFAILECLRNALRQAGLGATAHGLQL